MKYSDGSPISFTLDHSDRYRVEMTHAAKLDGGWVEGEPEYAEIIGWAVAQIHYPDDDPTSTVEPVILVDGRPVGMRVHSQDYDVPNEDQLRWRVIKTVQETRRGLEADL